VNIPIIRRKARKSEVHAVISLFIRRIIYGKIKEFFLKGWSINMPFYQNPILIHILSALH